MFRVRRQFGFTLVEILVVLAVVMLLAGALLGVGKYITVRAQVQLCESQLEVISTALEQYYDDHETFPVAVLNEGHLIAALGGGTMSGTFSTVDIAASSSAALFYFLDKSVNSRKIIEALSGDLLTNKDGTGADLTIDLASGDTIDLVRFIDPWDMSIRYEYAAGAAFPKLTAAGPDKEFDTADDIKSP
ncbi:MAG: type II secretion system protein [Planctomycetota bacterium]|jgi:prepilin-type N-terminal cleavage/methylation domain-containing protein